MAPVKEVRPVQETVQGLEVGEASPVEKPVHLSELPEGEQKAHEIAPKIIASTDQPAPGDSMEGHTVAKGPVVVEVLVRFPNLAWEAIQAGLEKEKISNAKLSGLIGKCRENQKNNDLLLDLNAELAILPDNKTSELSEKALSIIQSLKERDIDLWRKEGAKITKEELVRLKSLISSFREKNQTELQTRFTTEIQVEIQSISSIMETLKKIHQESKTLMDVILRHITEGR